MCLYLKVLRLTRLFYYSSFVIIYSMFYRYHTDLKYPEEQQNLLLTINMEEKLQPEHCQNKPCKNNILQSLQKHQLFPFVLGCRELTGMPVILLFHHCRKPEHGTGPRWHTRTSYPPSFWNLLWAQPQLTTSAIIPVVPETITSYPHPCNCHLCSSQCSLKPCNTPSKAQPEWSG